MSHLAHRPDPHDGPRREAAADRGAPAAFTAQAISSLRSKEGDKKRAELTEQVRTRIPVPCSLVRSPVQPESRLGFLMSTHYGACHKPLVERRRCTWRRKRGQVEAMRMLVELAADLMRGVFAAVSAGAAGAAGRDRSVQGAGAGVCDGSQEAGAGGDEGHEHAAG